VGAAVSALAVDAGAGLAVGQAETQIVHRLGVESEGGIHTEYEAGKLYLLGMEKAAHPHDRSRAPTWVTSSAT